MDDKKTVFISYAWGGPLAKKEWLRDDIVLHLSSEFSVFWDRDSITFGETVDEAISKALAERPLTVLCLCDQEYIASASKVGSGLHRELTMLAQIVDSENVRVIPIILDRECRSDLPAALAGRAYLDLSSLHSRGLSLCYAMLAVTTGGTQAQLVALLSDQLRTADVREKARTYFSHLPTTLRGNGLTHVVKDSRGDALLPPQWMCNSSQWKYMLSDEEETFCPSKGIWHWDRWSPSRGMCALGTAACAAFFSNKTDIDDIDAIERAGLLLAESYFRFVKKTESFILDPDDLVSALISRHGGIDLLERLLSSPPVTAPVS
ncbi:TIR domain-containing protein [Caballeronia sp. KNU42]